MNEGWAKQLKFVTKFSWLILLVYCVVFNSPLLFRERLIPADEIISADSVYSIYSGSNVPILPIWAHVIPEFSTFNHWYPPFYYLTVGYLLRIIGFSVSSFGIVHLFVRALTVLVLYVFLRLKKLPSIYILIFGFWWMSVVPSGFYTGRPDDFSIFFVLISILLAQKENGLPSRLRWIGAGGFLGLAFLYYPVALIIGGLIFLIILCEQNEISIKAIMLYGFTCGIVCSIWLFWLIPYWVEFTAIFLGFVAPDASAQKILSSLFTHLRHLTIGIGPIYKFETSIIPLLIIILLAFVDVWRVKRVFPKNIFLLFMGSVISFLLLISRNRSHPYSTIWLTILILLISLILLLNTKSEGHWNKGIFRYIRVFAMSLFAMQILVLFGSQLLQLQKLVLSHYFCHIDIYEEIHSLVPTGANVITQDGQVFYSLRSTNNIVWPAALTGTTPGHVPFSSNYDETDYWLVTARPIEEYQFLGMKFKWDEATYEYFSTNYELWARIGERGACLTCNLVFLS